MRGFFVIAGIGALTAFSVVSHGAPNPGSRQCNCRFAADKDNGSPILKVDPSCPVVQVVLSNPTTTRARVVFQREAEQHELEWDPALDPRLMQSFIAEQGAGAWNVSFQVDPVELRQGDIETLISFDGSTIDAEGNVALSARSVSTDTAGKATPLPKWPTPSWTASCAPLPAIGATPYVPMLGATNSGARGLGAIPEPVAQTLSLLGEIAVERAKSGALAILKSHFVTPFCGDGSDTHPGVHLSIFGLSGSLGNRIAFPRSCGLLNQLRIEDVLASGKPLLRAVADDLRSTIAPAVIGQIAGGSAWGTIASQALDILNRALDRGSFSVVDAEAALDLFLDVTPFITSGPELIGAASRTTLQTAVRGLPQCSHARDPATCAQDLISTIDLTKLASLFPGSDSDIANAIADLKARAPFEVALGQQLATLQIKPHDIVACHGDQDLAECVRRLVRSWDTAGDVARTLEQFGVDSAARKAVLDVAMKALLSHITTSLDSVTPPRLRELTELAQIACTARLAVGIVRRCSSGGGCSNDRIANMFIHPDAYFSSRDTSTDVRNPQVVSDKVCWSGPDHTYRVATSKLPEFEGFVSDGLQILAATNQSASSRASEILRMFTRVSLQVAGCTGDSTVTSNCRELAAAGDLLVAVADEDHARALTMAVSLASIAMSNLPTKEALKERHWLTLGTELIGTVAAYAQVYDETKKLDPAAAAAARKKALENLIDAATDRHGREGDRVVSIGSNVGIGPVYTVPRAHDAMQNGTDPNRAGLSPQLRVPISLNYDHLPGDGFAWHVGVTIGDLGQFAAVDANGKLEPVRWDNFLSPGVEFGWIFGSVQNAGNISIHVEYTPALYSSSTAGGAWRMGITLGYYVPFFDFN